MQRNTFILATVAVAMLGIHGCARRGFGEPVFDAGESYSRHHRTPRGHYRQQEPAYYSDDQPQQQQEYYRQVKPLPEPRLQGPRNRNLSADRAECRDLAIQSSGYDGEVVEQGGKWALILGATGAAVGAVFGSPEVGAAVGGAVGGIGGATTEAASQDRAYREAYAACFKMRGYRVVGWR